jgi:nitroimidazol reductase NimA-like FMN-containing flavoprotein (pyridoxamine 5'-phosphate oxidase superfamily)
MAVMTESTGNPPPFNAAMERQRYSRVMALDAEEVHEILRSARLARVATVPAGRRTPHVTPMMFAWDGSAIWLYSIVKSKRWSDWTSNPRVAVTVDVGERAQEFRGVEIVGQAEPVGPVPRAETSHPDLDVPERIWDDKNPGGFHVDGRHAWVRIVPEKIVSWDLARLAGLARERRQAD